MEYNTSLVEVWARVCSKFSEEAGDGVFKSWIEPLAPVAIENNRLILSAPTRFMRDWVDTHYSRRIFELVKDQNPDVISIDINVGVSFKENPILVKSSQEKIDHEEEIDAEKEDDALSLRLDPNYTFDNFVVGKPNELAYAAALRIAESEQVPFNPLFLHGGVGLGKTHLMHAIAWYIKENQPHRKVLYLSAEKFMYQFIRALRYKDTMAFKDKFRSVDVLMVDDVQFICGKESTQEEFFHTFNALFDKKRLLILSADKSPSDLDGIEERMRSRLGWGLVADIHPTTYELRLGILQAKAEKLPVALPADVMEFLATRISTNVRELEGAVNRLVAHATLVGRSITADMTNEVLRDLVRVYDRKISVDDIQKKVSDHFRIKMSELLSSRRTIQFARPRQIAMYLSKQMTSHSFPEIGRRFGGKDHTTVLHAVKKIEDLIKEDQEVAENIETLKRILQS